MSFQSESLDRIFKSSVLLALLVTLFYFAGNILFPILFALFIVLALRGVMSWFDKKEIPVFLSAFTITIIMALLFIGVILVIVLQGIELTRDISGPSGNETMAGMQHLIELAEQKFTVLGDDAADPISSMATNGLKLVGNVVLSLVSGLQSTLVFLSLIPIYVFFMLTFRKNADLFISAQFDWRREQEIRSMINEISRILRSYLAGLFFVILLVGILNSIGLTIIGVKHGVFLGLATALLMVIPYIGVMLGAIIPATFALVTLPSPWYAIAVLAMYAGIQFIEGNYITPKVVGGAVNLNPLTIIIGMIVFGVIGGMIALILAIPILAVIRILLLHSKRYNHVAILMQNN